MLLCNKCFKSRKECTCNPTTRGFVEIDDEIVEHIRILNEKGYETTNCCAGHIENIWFTPYITFKNKYNFDTMPELFTYNKRLKGLYYTNKWEDIKDRKQRQVIATNARNVLLDWIRDLPSIKE